MSPFKKKQPHELGVGDVPLIIAHYIVRNKFSLILLLLCVSIGISGLAGFSTLPPYKNWELSALTFTFIYTGYLYFHGIRKGYFKDLRGDTAVVIGGSMMALLFTILVSGNEFFHLFNADVGRRSSMIVLLITTLLFVYLDFSLFRSLATSHPEVSRAFFLSLKFSDIPVLIAFAFLTLYAFILGSAKLAQTQMEAFFGGTIAFQMMLSNIIWTLTDDVFVESAHLPRTSPTRTKD